MHAATKIFGTNEVSKSSAAIKSLYNNRLLRKLVDRAGFSLAACKPQISVGFEPSVYASMCQFIVPVARVLFRYRESNFG